MKRILLASLAGLALMSCSQSAPKQDWNRFVRQNIETWYQHDPAFAVYQGDHRFDGKLPDWSEAGLKARREFLHRLVDEAGAYRNLASKEAFERDYLVQAARRELFWIEDADQPHTNPSWYVGGGLDPNVYVSREYAGKAERMKAMIAFFKAVPQAAAQIRANLKSPLPATFVKYGIAGFGGFADYYRGDARAAFADVRDAQLQAEFVETSEQAAKAMDGLRDWMKGQEASAAQDFALGAERFSRMLKETEAVDIALDDLEAAGRADLERNLRALTEECARFAPGSPVKDCMSSLNARKPARGPVAEATQQIPVLTEFVKRHDLVTIPGTEKALVRESPPYNRQNSAYIDPAGPLEHNIPSIYYISPPDPSWPREKQLAYVPAINDLLFTSVHEIMPGHFLQFLHSNRSSSEVGRLFVGYAFAEGWAHYSEEMMVEAGLGDGNPEVHIGQLSKALLRNCRFLSAIGLHARGMTVEQSKRLFMDKCMQDEGNADQQAARGTYDPAYLNYTLGKLLIRKLREDWTASRGGRAAWKPFHDTFLSYGGPPIPLVRQAMMQEDKPRALF
ncbi:MAG: DUF885 domain-containing protein [Novosphingobium sp.]